MSVNAPVLFVSHGSPTFAVEPGLAGPRLTEMGRALPPIEAALVVSAHWMTRGGVAVTAATQPETIHDFGGFPASLYELQYPAPGHPALAARTARLLKQAGYVASLDSRRGLDHGAWVPLRHLLPAASVPVFQVSLPHPLDPAGALQLGKALAPLRQEGVMIVGSGSLTHNLYEAVLQQSGSEATYVAEFTDWVREALVRDDIASLLDYRRLAPHAERAHPTDEHFLPLFVALGAKTENDALTVIDGGIEHGVLSMDAYGFGITGLRP